MDYSHRLAFRAFLAILISLSYNMFYSIINPITFYASYAITKIFYPVNINGFVLTIGDVHLEFVHACAAVAAYILLALLIIFTKDIKSGLGLKMFVVGSLLVFIMNILRIEFLLYVLVNYGKGAFDTVHFLIWSIVSSLFVVAVWIYLVKKYKVKNIPFYSDFVYLRKIARLRG